MRLLSKININNANLEEEFFPFFHVENCFGNELDSNELLRDFPSISAGGSFPTEKLSQGPLKNLIEELEGAEFKSIIEDKFSNRKIGKIIHLMCRYRKIGCVHECLQIRF